MMPEPSASSSRCTRDSTAAGSTSLKTPNLRRALKSSPTEMEPEPSASKASKTVVKLVPFFFSVVNKTARSLAFVTWSEAAGAGSNVSSFRTNWSNSWRSTWPSPSVSNSSRTIFSMAAESAPRNKSSPPILSNPLKSSAGEMDPLRSTSKASNASLKQVPEASTRRRTALRCLAALDVPPGFDFAAFPASKANLFELTKALSSARSKRPSFVAPLSRMAMALAASA
mmetsp:Transcript_19095/g.64504  ORF Transcript_19095/g.64504 Transcript_19095/m.64504 type:complete len:227 (-) Transcript_19095:2095-2775(-)